MRQAAERRMGNRSVVPVGLAAQAADLRTPRSPNGAVTVTGWCQLRVASSFLL